MARFQCCICRKVIHGSKRGGYQMAGVDGYICKPCLNDEDRFTTDEVQRIIAHTKHLRTRELHNEQNCRTHQKSTPSSNTTTD